MGQELHFCDLLFFDWSKIFRHDVWELSNLWTKLLILKSLSLVHTTLHVSKERMMTCFTHTHFSPEIQDANKPNLPMPWWWYSIEVTPSNLKPSKPYSSIHHRRFDRRNRSTSQLAKHTNRHTHTQTLKVRSTRSCELFTHLIMHFTHQKLIFTATGHSHIDIQSSIMLEMECQWQEMVFSLTTP